MNAIPVERAQDLAVTGKGTVTLELGKCMVTGVGTEFKTAFAQPKSSLAVKVPSGGGKHETFVVLWECVVRAASSICPPPPT